MSIARGTRGTLGALSNAGTDTTDHDTEGISLTGDLSQMGTMGRVLRTAGFDVRNADVYPVIQGREEIVRALRYLWDHMIDGWWNQSDAMVKYGICTFDEYRERLSLQCDRDR